MQFNEIPDTELNWTEKPVIGILLMTAEKDSDGNPIDPNVFYKVAKHIPSGMIIIVATERNQKHEFVNDVLKSQGKFN